MSSYLEHPVPKGLTARIACVWSVRDDFSGVHAAPRRILPDGCADIILRYDHSGVRTWELTDAWVTGPMTRSEVVAPAPAALFIGIRLAPASLGAVLRTRASDVTDADVPLCRIWRRSWAHLAAARAASSGSGERVLAQRAVLALAGDISAAGDAPSEVERAVAILTASHGQVGIDVLANQVRCSRQHLARQFGVHVGLSPKTFARVMRLQGVIGAIRSPSALEGSGWSSLACHFGYSDQPHLSAEFQQLVGVAPGAWLREQRGH